MRLEYYIPVGQKRLRCGYTTGTCAAAAARAAAQRLLTGQWPAAVVIDTPAGIPVTVEPEALECGPGWASCAVRKDGGDDPDATHGALIVARVERTDGPGLTVDGGVGVGRVTRPGLDQGVGEAAINSVPRKMILRELSEALNQAGAECGLSAVISVPEGETIAKRTFNPNLGIVGGISILGTSGIVRPMSEQALVSSLYLELSQLAAAGKRDIVLTPGNYGEAFCRKQLGLKLTSWASCSNYLGQTIDQAVVLELNSILLVGHLGKLCKTAAGNFNTHSRVCDSRREVMTAHAALCGASPALIRAVFDAPTTDAALSLLDGEGLREAVCRSLTQELGRRLRARAGEGLHIEAIVFSKQYGLLGKTEGADALLALHRTKEEQL